MINIQATEFSDIPSKTVTYGFRAWDNQGASWVAGMQRSDIPTNDLELLAMVVRQAQTDDAIIQMLVATSDCRNSAIINGKEYTWDVIAPILASGGREVPKTNPTPEPSGIN